MLDHKLKRKWVAALRGGTWRQMAGGYGVENTNYRCAFGVLREVINPNEPYATALVIPGLSNAYEWDRIVNMNDKEGKSFSEIADWIEQNL